MLAGGRGAFNALRVEKGYRAWGTDMTTEHDPYEAGLGFAVKPDKGDFIGREALLERKEAGPRRKLVCLVLDDPNVVVMGNEPVWADTAVGYVTSADFGYSLGQSIAYAWVLTRARRGGEQAGDRILRRASSGHGHRGAALRSGDEEDEGMMEAYGPNRAKGEMFDGR